MLLPGLAITLAYACAVGAAQPPAAQPVTAAPASTGSVLKLNLSEAVSMAMGQQPRLAAQRASLCVAEDACRALDALRLLNCFDPEIGVRRRQAALGVTAAVANLDKAERETVYAVTRTYLTVLYAREQERVARGVADRLLAIKDSAERQVKAGSPDVTDYDVRRTGVYLGIAQTQRIQAAQGVERALAALREAIGVGAGVAIEVPAGTLAFPQLQPVQEDIVALALARRNEVVQASVFVDVTCLEVEAQSTCCLIKQMNTFAAAADIHALQVPQGSNDADYRPSAVAPEMPTTLAGSRPERMKRAADLNLRAVAVLDTTRNLIALEAQDAFLRWQQAGAQLAEARTAADAGDKLSEDLNQDWINRLKVKIEDVIGARVLAAQARVQYNEYFFKQLIALADLERVTAGGFSAGLAELYSPQVPPPQKSK
jgi:outer membrane protein TolC